jgi:Flp pilus assembly protein CpaB
MNKKKTYNITAIVLHNVRVLKLAQEYNFLEAKHTYISLLLNVQFSSILSYVPEN